ncbi:hypothetical protein DER46DRAFT_63273 [Fusarium sp. MPI-SDFR-AT-0072]|nr:hypothetical protein DER46DRAFT_63273 [Fusarium sp. MPI-SDFR-AT-0072]
MHILIPMLYVTVLPFPLCKGSLLRTDGNRDVKSTVHQFQRAPCLIIRCGGRNSSTFALRLRDLVTLSQLSILCDSDSYHCSLNIISLI